MKYRGQFLNACTDTKKLWKWLEQLRAMGLPCAATQRLVPIYDRRADHSQYLVKSECIQYLSLSDERSSWMSWWYAPSLCYSLINCLVQSFHSLRYLCTLLKVIAMTAPHTLTKDLSAILCFQWSHSPANVVV